MSAFFLNAFATYSTLYASILELVLLIVDIECSFHLVMLDLCGLRRLAFFLYIGSELLIFVLNETWVCADGEGARCNLGPWRSLCC